MNDIDRDAALLSAVTTEHFVLQSAASATSADAASRSSLYMLALSSSLVAIGFTSRSPGVFQAFATVILPVIFVVGLLTTIRLIEITLENQQHLSNIARVRAYYRTLSPAAETYFSTDTGRWPESGYNPSARLGSLMASLSTTATMIALINNVVGAAAVVLLIRLYLGSAYAALSWVAGSATFVGLCVAFLVFENWRFRETRGYAQRATAEVSAPSSGELPRRG